MDTGCVHNMVSSHFSGGFSEYLFGGSLIHEKESLLFDALNVELYIPDGCSENN